VRATAFESNRRLLVVDDNVATRYATSRVLRAAGFEVLECESGEEALDEVERGVDLVVLDVNLPGIDGFEVCRRIRADPQTAILPIVHLSASFVEDHDRESGYDAGADQYLTHPVEPVVLVGAINACLRMRGAESARRSMEIDRERLLLSERAARKDAEHANELKDQFLAMLSHELRNPLNAVVGWAQVLRHRFDDPMLQKGLNIILKAAHTQAQLISDLLEVSRITSGKLHIELQPVRIDELVADAVEAAESDARAVEVSTHVLLPAAPVYVAADPARLQQVFWNLLSNAVKFTPRGGRIDVSVERGDDGCARIVVADTGCGISPEFLPHIFERFRQADASMRKRHGGLGLGLSIVSLLVEAHGGDVRAESAGEGLGSTFTVTLPLAAAPAAGATVPPLPHGREALRDAVDLAGARVLIVEDDGPSCEMVATLLADHGANTLQANSVEEALARLPGFAPELLISDIGMPIRDGYDLIRTLRAQGYDSGRLPAIALTAFAGSIDRELALAAGFQRHLAKPLRAEHLLSLAAELLQSQE
jgi:signal transduction histidine kinase